MNVAGVVLAAGASTRLGRAKQTVVVGGEMLVVRAARVAMEAGLSPLIVVIRPDADFGPMLQQMGAVPVVNLHVAEGMASSIRAGIERLQMTHVDGAIVMTCDQVKMRAEHLTALAAKADEIKASSYAGRRGVPAYFPVGIFDELLRLRGDAGARDLLRGASAIEDEALALDLDTEDDLLRALNDRIEG